MDVIIKRPYPGTQTEFLTVAEFIWNKCGLLITDFHAFSPRFTPALVAGNLDLIEQARHQHSFQMLKSDVSAARRTVVERSKKLLALCQQLKTYIETAFPPDYYEGLYAAAGFNFYRKASKNAWLSAKSMGVQALAFVNNHFEELTAGGVMPPVFPLIFQAALQEFNESLNLLIAAKKASADGAGDRNKLDLFIYKSLMNVLHAGKVIFMDEPQNRKYFVYNDVRKLMRGQKQSGLKGIITEDTGKLPVTGASIRVLEENRQTSTGEGGRFELALRSGSWLVEVSKPGYKTQVLYQTVKVGVMSRLNVRLEKAGSNVAGTLQLSGQVAGGY